MPVWTTSKNSAPIAIIIFHWEEKWESGSQAPQEKIATYSDPSKALLYVVWC